MNSRILMAFLAGAAFASGIVFMAVKEPTLPVRHVAAASKPIYVTPAAAGPAQPEKQPKAAPEAQPEAQPAQRASVRMDPRPAKAVREKPSPMSSAPKMVTAELKAPSLPPQARPELPAPAPEPAPAAQPPTYTPPPAPAPEPTVIPQQRTEEAPRVEPPQPQGPQPHTVTITAGTVLPVRIGETLTANRNQPGDSFLATLDQPLVVEGFVIAERGARLEGRVVEADQGGRVRGNSHLDVELVKLATSDGQHIRIRTSPFEKQSQPSMGTDAAKVGVGAAIGAAIGGIAGGGKGAGIGAGVGGAAGAGDVLLTRGKAATIPVETRISFRLQEPVTITERLR